MQATPLKLGPSVAPFPDHLIPLSWSKINSPTPLIPKTVQLSSGSLFLPFARVGSVPRESYLSSLCHIIDQENGVIFRGASETLLEEIRKVTPVIALPLGSEAILHLEKFQPKNSLP